MVASVPRLWNRRPHQRTEKQSEPEAFGCSKRCIRDARGHAGSVVSAQANKRTDRKTKPCTNKASDQGMMHTMCLSGAVANSVSRI
jgi:hypothetical protein